MNYTKLSCKCLTRITKKVLSAKNFKRGLSFLVKKKKMKAEAKVTKAVPHASEQTAAVLMTVGLVVLVGACPGNRRDSRRILGACL